MTAFYDYFIHFDLIKMYVLIKYAQMSIQTKKRFPKFYYYEGSAFGLFNSFKL